MMFLKLGRRRLHQFEQHGPGVGHHRDPVTVDLVGEPVGSTPRVKAMRDPPATAPPRPTIRPDGWCSGVRQ